MTVDPVDHVVLNGTTLLCDGVQAGKSVSEFTSGMKIGRATYDDRQHAFYTVLDDFSGGFGHRQLDIREALGTHWDNPGGVDLRRARHITLPPKRYVISTDNDPGKMLISSAILSSAITGTPRRTRGAGYTSYYYYAAGDTIYRMDDDRDALTRVQQMTYHAADGPIKSSADNIPEGMSRFVHFRSPSGTYRLYLITVNGNEAGSSSRFLYSEDPDADSPTWTEGQKALWDMIVAPVGPEGANIVIAQDINMQFMFSSDPTTGIDWNVDGAAPNDAPAWQPNSICRFMGIASLPQVPGIGVYFIDYGDGRLYSYAHHARKAFPIEIGDYHYLVNGVVWQGNVAVTDGWDIWLYTPGGGGTETVRKIGLWGKDGTPDSLRAGRYRITGLIDGGHQLFAIAERTALDKAQATATLGFVIFVYNGAGWSQFMEPQEAAATSTTIAVNPIAAIIDRYPIGVIAAADMQVQTSRALNVLCQMHPTSAKKVRVHSFRLPQVGTIPIDGIDEFDDPGSDGFRVGWIDGGFRDIKGTLYYVKVDLQECLAGSKVEVSYRLDDDESGGWTVLGTASVRGTPDANVFQFDVTNEAGVEFRTVQFKIRVWRDAATQLNGQMDNVTTGGTYNVDDTEGWPDTGLLEIDDEVLYYSSKATTSFTVPNTTPSSRGMRGTDVATHVDDTKINVINRSPELRAITLVYSKKAKLRKTWVVLVDVDKMVEQKTQVDTDEDGAPDANASHQNVWDFLEALWDKHTLVKLVVPEAEPTGDNLRVEIADMVLARDDARLTSTTRGRINLTLLEPVKA